MFLSKVWLKPGHLDNAWEWHRAIWTLFPGIEREPNESSPFLFRLETLQLDQGATLLMLSSLRPEDESAKAKVVAIKELNQAMSTGQHLHFMVTANVTKAIRDSTDTERKIRVPLIKEEEQLAWLKRKLEGIASFDVQNIRIQDHSPIYFHKGRRTGKIVPLTFEGMLRVENPEALQALMQKGVGAAKAFGCGLLLVRRA